MHHHVQQDKNGCLENSGNSDVATYVVLQETQCRPGFSNYPISEVHVNTSDLIFRIIEILPWYHLTQKKKKITPPLGKVGQWLDYSSISACCHYSELSIAAEVRNNAEPPPSELTPSSVPTSSSPHWGHGQHRGVWPLSPERWLGLYPAGALCSEKKETETIVLRVTHMVNTLTSVLLFEIVLWKWLRGDSTSAEVNE